VTHSWLALARVLKRLEKESIRIVGELVADVQKQKEKEKKQSMKLKATMRSDMK
jgi:hypothetical protein